MFLFIYYFLLDEYLNMRLCPDLIQSMYVDQRSQQYLNSLSQKEMWLNSIWNQNQLINADITKI